MRLVALPCTFLELASNYYIVVTRTDESVNAAIAYLDTASESRALLWFTRTYEKESARQMADMESVA